MSLVKKASFKTKWKKKLQPLLRKILCLIWCLLKIIIFVKRDEYCQNCGKSLKICWLSFVSYLQYLSIILNIVTSKRQLLCNVQNITYPILKMFVIIGGENVCRKKGQNSLSFYNCFFLHVIHVLFCFSRHQKKVTLLIRIFKPGYLRYLLWR